jgi:hypothetical protein
LFDVENVGVLWKSRWSHNFVDAPAFTEPR